MLKEVKFKKGNLVIGYCDNSTDISIFESREIEPLTLTFIPTVVMNGSQCLEYTNQIIHKIIKETEIVISEMNEFYGNFEIEFDSQFIANSSYRHLANRNLLIVYDSWMHISWELKKVVKSVNN